MFAETDPYVISARTLREGKFFPTALLPDSGFTQPKTVFLVICLSAGEGRIIVI